MGCKSMIITCKIGTKTFEFVKLEMHRIICHVAILELLRSCKHYFLSPVDCNSCMQILVTAVVYPFSWNIYAEEGVLHVL
jgi:hypothetical protein